MTRDKAWGIVKKYVKNENLRRHMLAAEAAMAKYWEYFSSENLGKVAPAVRSPLPWSTSTRRGVATAGFGRAS